jgi:predicted sugar kinase
MNTLPTDDLEIKAADQRRRLQSSVHELKDRVREKLDVKRNISQHVLLASAIAGAMSLGFGYSVAGVFTRSRSNR